MTGPYARAVAAHIEYALAHGIDHDDVAYRGAFAQSREADLPIIGIRRPTRHTVARDARETANL